ncbi:MAG: TRAP transporter small permease [Alphaproteobacteria bacterium]
MNAMNVLPLQVTAAATLLALVFTFWLKSGDGLRARLRAGVLTLDRIGSTIAAIIACLALAVAVCAGLWQVGARFATETPSVWSEALVRTALIWMAFIGLAVALRAGALVSIDIAHRLSRGLLRNILEGLSLASILLMLGVMFWFGWSMAERVKFQEMAGMEVSIAWGYAAIPIGAVFAMLGSIAHFLDRRSEELESAV